MAVNARKQRVLAIAALALTIILLISFTQSGANIETSSSSLNLTNQNELVKDKSGIIDESKVKLAEENSKIIVKSEAQLHNDLPEGTKEFGNINKPKPKYDSKESNGNGGAEIMHVKNTVKPESNGDVKNAITPDSNGEFMIVKNTVKPNVAEIVDTDNDNSDSKKKISKKKEKGIEKEDKKVDLSEIKKEDNGKFNAAKEFKEILSLSPVVIFSKSYCPYSQKLKSLLKQSYSISPEPAIVELDLHKNGKELQNYIGEQSGRNTVPNLFINGISRGGCDETVNLHNKNELLDSLLNWGGNNIKVIKINAPSNQ